MVVVEDHREAEVNYFQGAVVGFGEQQEILGLEVSMADAVRVAVVHSLNDLHESSASLIFRKVAFVDDTIEEFAAFAHSREIVMTMSTPSPGTRYECLRRSQTI